MAYIKEPDGIDFIIKSEPLTNEERAAISAYIREYKEAHAVKAPKKNEVYKNKAIAIK